MDTILTVIQLMALEVEHRIRWRQVVKLNVSTNGRNTNAAAGHVGYVSRLVGPYLDVI